MSFAKAGVLQLAPQAGEPQQSQGYIDMARLLVTGTRNFYNNPTFSDITIVCPDGRQLQCHQVILAASSKRFEGLLKQGDFTGSKLPVQGVDSDALDTLIDSFYTGECALTLATAASVYDAAVKLEVNVLPTAIEQFVSNRLTPSNACLLLDRAMSTKAGRLMEVCLAFIRTRLGDVVPTLEFSTASMDVVGQICTDVANNRPPPQLALQVAIAWLQGAPNGPSRAHLLPALAELIGVPADVLRTYMRSATTSATSSGANPPGGGGGNSGRGGGSGNGGGAGGGGGVSGNGSGGSSAGGGGGGGMSLLGEPPSLEGSLPLSSLPLLQLLPPGQLQQLGMSGGAGAAAAQLLLGQGAKGGTTTTSTTTTAVLRSLLEEGDGVGGGGKGGGGVGPAGLGLAGMAGLDGNSVLAQRLGNLAGLRRELEEGAAVGGGGGGSGGAGGLVANAIVAAAAAHRGKRQRTEDGRRSSGWGAEALASLSRGLSGEADLMAAQAGGAGGFVGSAPLALTSSQMPILQAYSDPQQQQQQPQRDRRTPQVKGVCHVEGCYADLTGLRDYHLRYKICEFHLKVSSVLKDGVPQRFCQQCGRFHNLAEFDGNRRSCRTMLARHNMRRAKKMGQGGSPVADDGAASAGHGAAAGTSAAAAVAAAQPDVKQLMQQLGPAGLAAALGASLGAAGGPHQAHQQPQAQAQQSQLQHSSQQQQQEHSAAQQLASLGMADGMSLSDAMAAAVAAMPGLQGGAGRRLNELIDGLGRAGNAGVVQVGSLLEAPGGGEEADGVGRGDDGKEGGLAGARRSGGGAAAAGGSGVGAGGADDRGDAAAAAAAQNDAMAALAAIVAAAGGGSGAGAGSWGQEEAEGSGRVVGKALGGSVGVNMIGGGAANGVSREGAAAERVPVSEEGAARLKPEPA